MPYVSPRGAVKSTIPPRRQRLPLEDSTDIAKPEEHVPSADLGEVNSRDGDPFIIQELEHWKGWSVKHEIDKDEKEDVDPLDEEPNSDVAEKTVIVERHQKEKRVPLRIVTEPSKWMVEVDEIEVNERFISDDLL